MTEEFTMKFHFQTLFLRVRLNVDCDTYSLKLHMTSVRNKASQLDND